MIIAGSILIGRALQPVELAVGAWKNFFDAKQQYDRLNMIMQSFPLGREAMSLPPIQGDIKISEAVICAPSSNQPIIRRASAHLKAGETALILGPSGAGKSTLIKGLLGLWPTVAGDIRIDGAEVKLFDRVELGPQLGYLPQDIELLQGSVSANIARFGDVEPEGVIQAARDAGVHEFILSLPNGYDTEIGKPGGMLSPGQRQRVALARALYKRPQVVILDEPNSNLDEHGEQALNAAIATLKQHGSTVIVVSHRKGVLPLVDQLVVLNNGVVVNAGPPAELLAAADAPKPADSNAKKALPVTTVTLPTGN
jgi:ATP-binding cassette subfamily C protein EexD